MLKNYFITALRNFKSNKLFSLINILGLSIGISSAIVIFLIVHYDLSFDRFEKDGDRIFRVVSQNTFQGNTRNSRAVPAPLAEAIRKDLSGIEETAAFRYFNMERLTVPGPDPTQPLIFERPSDIIFAEGNYFKLLPYKWLEGSPLSALEEPNRVVLTETCARLYFPKLSYKNIIGRKIIYEDSIPTVVSGIVQDLDRQGNTDFSFMEFISLPTLLDNKSMRDRFFWDQWGSSTSDQEVYVRLKTGIRPESVEARLQILHDQYIKKDAHNIQTGTYLLQALSDIHFNGKYGTFKPNLANKPTLYGLMLVAAFLLFLGCINFINLTTALASQRAREIGIRKTMGSSRRQLIFQFLIETFLTTFIATALSLGLAPLLLKMFAGFIPEGLHFSVGQPYLFAFLAILIPLVTLLAGFYPALVLSSWQPIMVLKNQAWSGTGKTRKAWIRQILTITQFVIAQAFIMSTLLVGKQIHYLLDKDMGFSKEAILSFRAPHSDTSYSRRLYLVHQLEIIPGVRSVSLGSDLPSSGSTRSTLMEYVDGKKEVQSEVEMKAGDAHYLDLFHIPLLAGRHILTGDTSRELLINENYLHVLGLARPQDALDKALDWGGKKWPIVGVMQDFHAHPLNYDIKPLAFIQADNSSRVLIIALHPLNKGNQDEWRTAIANIGEVYKKTYPGEEFNYAFFDESLAAAYKTEQRISELLKWATGLTVFISCMGLLGLVVYTTHHRTKEISVRKVLGASVYQIVSILSIDFIKLVLVAFLLATPLAWWVLHNWLEDFAYRTTINPWVFLVSGMGMILIALLTLSVQTIRAAMTNPVKNLKTE